MDPFKFAPVFANSDFNTRKEVTFDVGDIKWKTEGEHKGSRINKKDIKSIRFLKLTQACYQIRVTMKGTGEYTFTGTRGLNDLAKFKDFIKSNYGIEMEEEPVNSRGINWGKVRFDTDMKTSAPESCLRFEIDNRLAFEVPYEEITRCANPGTSRNTLTLDFAGPKGKGNAHSVESITFIVNGKANIASGLKQKISSKSKAGTDTEKLCAQFETLKFMTPRARFSAEFYENFVIFHGASQDYKVFYKEIEKLIYVAASSETMYLVISIGSSVASSSRSSNTKAKDFVLSLENGMDEMELTKVILDQTWQERPKIVSCAKTQAELLSNLLSDLTGRNLALSDEDYQSAEAKKFARCTCKGRGNESGSLYPLKAGIIFLHKPVIYIRYQDISFVRFSEISGMSSARSNLNSTFELTFVMKSREEDHFTGIYLSELDALYNLFEAKKVAMRNADDKVIKSKLDIGVKSTRNHDRSAGSNYASGFNDDSDEDDEDFDDDGEEDDEDEDFDAINDDGEDAEEEEDDDDEDEDKDSSKTKEHKRHHHHKKSDGESKSSELPPQKKMKSEEDSK